MVLEKSAFEIDFAKNALSLALSNINSKFYHWAFGLFASHRDRNVDSLTVGGAENECWSPWWHMNGKHTQLDMESTLTASCTVHFMCSAWAARVAPKPSRGIAQSTAEKMFVVDLLEILSRVWPPLISKMILKLNIFFMPCFLFDSSSSGENRCVLSLIQGRFLKPHVCWTMLMVSLVLHWDVSKCWGATIWINLTMSPTTVCSDPKKANAIILTGKPITLTGKPNRIWWIRGQAWAPKKIGNHVSSFKQLSNFSTSNLLDLRLCSARGDGRLMSWLWECFSTLAIFGQNSKSEITQGL